MSFFVCSVKISLPTYKKKNQIMMKTGMMEKKTRAQMKRTWTQRRYRLKNKTSEGSLKQEPCNITSQYKLFGIGLLNPRLICKTRLPLHGTFLRLFITRLQELHGRLFVRTRKKQHVMLGLAFSKVGIDHLRRQVLLRFSMK